MGSSTTKEGEATKRFLVVIVSVFLVSCGSTPTPDLEATVQSAIIATQTAMPTVTPTPASTDTPTPTATPKPTPTATRELSAGPLESLLVRSGDLPSGVLAGQIKTMPLKTIPCKGAWLELKEVNETEYIDAIAQEFAGGELEGAVMVYLYDDLQERDTAFELMKDLITGIDEKKQHIELTHVSEDGEVPFLVYSWYPDALVASLGIKNQSSGVILTECHALIGIGVGGSKDYDMVLNYSVRLLGRLLPHICRPEELSAD